MPFFTYKAKNGEGKIQRGQVEASSLQRAGETLIEKGLFVIDVKPVVENTFTQVTKKVKSVKFADVVIFTRQLASIVEAGLTLTMGITLLIEQAKPNMKILLIQILNDLESGVSFNQALAKHPKIFDKSYISLVRAGESSGSLDLILNRLADNMEERKDFQSKVKGAMIYPAVILLVMGVVGIIMMVVVVPKLLEVFNEFGADLPLPTKILIAISDFLTNFWWAIILIIIGLISAFMVWYRNDDSKRIVDNYIFKVPILGNLRKKTILTNFAQTLAMLIKAGVPLVESLSLAAEGMSSINYRDYLKVVGEKVEKGVALGTALGVYEDFPMVMAQMVKVGEETGKLDDILFKLSQYFKGEAERAVAGLMAAFEPVIMVVLGLAVGFVVIAIIMPIYDLTNQISA